MAQIGEGSRGGLTTVKATAAQMNWTWRGVTWTIAYLPNLGYPGYPSDRHHGKRETPSYKTPNYKTLSYKTLSNKTLTDGWRSLVNHQSACSQSRVTFNWLEVEAVVVFRANEPHRLHIHWLASCACCTQYFRLRSLSFVCLLMNSMRYCSLSGLQCRASMECSPLQSLWRPHCLSRSNRSPRSARGVGSCTLS